MQTISSTNELARALCAALPPEQQWRGEKLAQALAAAAQGDRAALADPTLRPVLQALSGAEVRTDGTLIDFRGAQLGEVRIDTIANGHLIKLNLHLPPSPLTLQQQHHRRMMIQKVRAIWVEGLLRHSLSETVRIELGLSERPDAVQLPLNTQYQELRRPPRELLAGTPMIDVFDESDGALLILGAPGAGKTTLLLELCRDLLDRADARENWPIPVIFNLSSWAARREPVKRWLVEELNKKYDIPRIIAQGWVAADLLLPMLDGLDEVTPAQREACVEAINAYRRSHLVPLVIASRLADYEALATRLRLQRAVLVRALRADQIDAYLCSAPASFAGLQAALTRSPELHEVASTPLMLNVLALAYAHRPVEDPGAEPSLARLWELFLIQVLMRRSTVDGLSPQSLLHHLAGLAGVMQRIGQSLFYVEQLQPEALPGRRWQQLYVLADRLGWSTLGALLVGVFSAIVLSWSQIPGYGLSLGPVVGVLTGSLIAMFSMPTQLQRGVRRTQWARIRAAASGWLAYGGLITLLFTLAILIYLMVIRHIEHPIAQMLHMAYGQTLWFLIKDVVWEPLTFSETLFYSLLVGLAAGSTLGLAGAMAGVFGLRPALGLRHITSIETLRWSRAQAWEGWRAGIRFGLVAGALFAGEVVISVVQSGLNHPVRGAAIMWLFSILACAGLGALLSGLTSPTLSTAIRPNEGIHRSVRSALAGGLIGGLVVGATLGVAIQLGMPLTFGLAVEPIFQNTIPSYIFLGSVIGLVSGLISALAFGGYAVLSHVALRLTLWRAGALPLRLVRFLDRCNDRALLRRVGGGYIFTHRLLLEHIASMTDQDIARLGAEIDSGQNQRP